MFYSELISGTSEMIDDVGNFIDSLGPTIEVSWYTVLWIRSLSMGLHIMFNLSGEKCMYWMIWCNSVGMFYLHEGTCHHYLHLVINIKVFINVTALTTTKPYCTLLYPQSESSVAK